VATGTPVTRYIHTDNLGSTNITSHANQNRAQWFDYAPYGVIAIEDGFSVPRRLSVGKADAVRHVGQLVLLVLPIPFQLPACAADSGRRIECSQCARVDRFGRAEGERCLVGALGARKNSKVV
jgi:hypothetical protein